MKKLLMICLILLGLLGLIACDVEFRPEPTQEATQMPEAFETIINQIENELPHRINGNFLLPQFEDVTITWSLDQQTFDELFIYESPFYDQEKILSARISNQEVYYIHDIPVHILASDSAANENRLYITLPGGHSQIERTTYKMAQMTFFQKTNDFEKIELHDNAVEIRGRGNSTWGMPKKPYRIRFSQDTSVYGMPEARNYVLLAEYADKSLLRNTIVHKFSSMLNHIEHAIQTRVVELYINDEYRGVYTLSEHVESHKNKLYIDVSYENLDAGYFLELDQRIFWSDPPEALWWFNLTGRAYEINRPNTEHINYTQGHTDYISNYLYEMQQALIQKQGYETLMDVDNFIDYFITQELFKNVDVGFSSVFMYKRQNDVLKMGPLWDFDLAIGNADYIDYGVENFYGFANDKNYWFHLMMHIPEIRQKFVERYNDIYYDIVPEILDMIDVFGLTMHGAAERNFEKWPILSTYVWPNPPEMVNARTYQGQVNYVRLYIALRAIWMFETLNTQAFLDGEYL